MRHVWLYEVKRNGRWVPSSFQYLTRQEARDIRSSIIPRVHLTGMLEYRGPIKYVPEGANGKD
jgi:hypothetical protein